MCSPQCWWLQACIWPSFSPGQRSTTAAGFWWTTSRSNFSKRSGNNKRVCCSLFIQSFRRMIWARDVVLLRCLFSHYSVVIFTPLWTPSIWALEGLLSFAFGIFGTAAAVQQRWSELLSCTKVLVSNASSHQSLLPPMSLPRRPINVFSQQMFFCWESQQILSNL